MASTKRQDQKAATAALMTATAAELFRQRGYEHVTIRDVAKAAGMSTGAVFSTFADKDDMFLKSMGRAAPNQERVAKFLHNAVAYGDAQISLEAAFLLGDLYGHPEQPE